MQAVGIVLALLTLIALVWGCLGLVSPRLARMPSRWWGAAAFVASMLLGQINSGIQQDLRTARAEAEAELTAEADAAYPERQALGEGWRREWLASRTPEEIAEAERQTAERAALAVIGQQTHQPAEPRVEVDPDDTSWCGNYRRIRTGMAFDEVRDLFGSPHDVDGGDYRWDISLFGDPLTLWVSVNASDRVMGKRQRGIVDLGTGLPCR